MATPAFEGVHFDPQVHFDALQSTVQITEIMDPVDTSCEDAVEEKQDTNNLQTGNGDAKADAKRCGGNAVRSLAPAMPTVKTPFPHKPRDQHWPLVNAMVARILSPKEAANDPKATAALEAEFEAQRKKRVWEEDKVEEWSTVCSRIRGRAKLPT